MRSPLVTVAELDRLLGLPEHESPVILDVRYAGPGGSAGVDDYEAGHIPGARFVDLETVLAEPADGGPGGRHPLPSADRFERGMRAAGVGAATPVVVYDDWSSIAAARAWWLLRHHGHGDVRVLDGGWRAWLAAGGEVETGEPSIETGDFLAAGGGLTSLDADGAAAVAASGVLLDGRAAQRFRGENETVDPVAGHIPGAVSLPSPELVDADGRLLPEGELRARFEAAGVGDGVPAAAYCGSGVQACHVALAAAVAGVSEDLGVYGGSWSDWITDPSRPVATG